MITVTYHDSVNVLQDQSLQANGFYHASPFDRPEWYQLLTQTGLPPLVVTAADGGETIALPLMHQSGRLSALCNWYTFAWRPIGVNSDHSVELLARVAAEVKARAHRVILEPVPNEDQSAKRLARAFAKAGWRVEVTQCDVNHYLDVAGRSFAEYWITRPGHLRTTLERKGGKVQTHIHEQFDPSFWDTYEAIYAASWKPTEGEPEMLRTFAQQEGEAGRLRLGIASLDGKPIAAQFWTVENGVAYIHKLAHVEEHKQLSAGTTLTAALFQKVIDGDKVSQIDFGTGDEAYKADWMECIRPRYRIDCLNMRSPKAWLDLAKLAVRRLKAQDAAELAQEPFAG